MKLIFLLAAVAAPASAQQPAQRNEVLYVEALPARTTTVARALRAYAAKTRAEPGAASVQLLREIGRPERFVVYETWKDEAALTAHNHRALNEQLAPLTLAPIDERLGGVLPAGAAIPAGAYHVVIHIDVAPPAAERAAGWFAAQADAAKTARGFLGFEVSVQAGRPNHFTIAEGWRSPQAYADYTASEAARHLRGQIAEVKGALFDERLYKAD